MAPVDDSAPAARPAVSVVLPFAGSNEEAKEAVRMLEQIALRAGDEIILVDNSGREPGVQADARVQVVRARREASSYYARNEGTAVARNPWLLFLDADCVPRADLLDRYFASVVADDTGAVVGEIEGVLDQTSVVSRYARSRGHLAQRRHWESAFRPWGVTANLLVRREAWASVGGFQEGIRSGGDAEFSWRLQDVGWRLEYRPDALVWHAHRDSLRRLIRQAARYGAGRAWLMRRYPDGHPRPVLVREILRSLAGVGVWTFAGQFERARFKALDAVYVTSEWTSFWLVSNRPLPARPQPSSIGLIASAYPSLDGQVTLDDSGTDDAHVEALHRPIRVDRERSRRSSVAYDEDEGGLRRALGAAALALTRPATVARRPRESLSVAGAARRLRQARVKTLRTLDTDPVTRRRADLLAQLLGVPHQD